MLLFNTIYNYFLIHRNLIFITILTLSCQSSINSTGGMTIRKPNSRKKNIVSVLIFKILTYFSVWQNYLQCDILAVSCLQQARWFYNITSGHNFLCGTVYTSTKISKTNTKCGIHLRFFYDIFEGRLHCGCTWKISLSNFNGNEV